jgi:hypothetical protein
VKPSGAGLPFPISQHVALPEAQPQLGPGEVLVEDLRPGDTVRIGTSSSYFTVERVEITGSRRQEVLVVDAAGTVRDYLAGEILRAWKPQRR